ncbi:MAG: hypothetical protein OXG55_09920 [bacterium]|nr:hypothetical protein [bacterium]MCY4103560.1 hypothetical protein [bacterium]
MIESLADQLLAVVLGDSRCAVELLLADELSVVVVMAAAHTPEQQVVG